MVFFDVFIGMFFGDAKVCSWQAVIEKAKAFIQRYTVDSAAV
jgi:hypothetical protein